MRIFEDKKIRLIVLVLFFSLGEFLNDRGPYSGIVVMAQIIVGIMILGTLWSMIKARFRKSEEYVKGIFAKVITRIFGPMMKNFIYGANKKNSFVSGSDKREFIGRLGFLGKTKKKTRKRKKIDINTCEGNAEKVRLLYTKYIIKSSEKGRDITFSQTPEEIKQSLDIDNNDLLFESYEQVRYNEHNSVDEDTVNKCCDIVDRL